MKKLLTLLSLVALAPNVFSGNVDSKRQLVGTNGKRQLVGTNGKRKIGTEGQLLGDEGQLLGDEGRLLGTEGSGLLGREGLGEGPASIMRDEGQLLGDEGEGE